MIFNMGISLEDNYVSGYFSRSYFDALRILLFILAAFIGWFLVRYKVKRGEEVTRTAIEISNGSIEKRVEVKRRHYEIDRLANTFNDMLDRIQTLIKGMHEMNDNVAHDLRAC
ncbi:MAG: HAMP domain-containing protein [Desulfobacterales bacterium]